MTGIEIVRSQSLGDLPRRTALRVPHKLALVAPSDGSQPERRWTFAELDAVIDRVAAAMTAAGLAKGDRLVLLSHNCWQYVVLDFAAARAGVVLTPVNFMLSAADVAFIVEHCEAAAVVVEDALIPLMDEALASIAHQVPIRVALGLGNAPVPQSWPELAGWLDHDDSRPEVAVADDDPIRLMYTSGTESRPKGAILTSRSLLWQMVSAVVDGGMDADDVDLHALPLYHCAQLDVFVGPDVYLGATSIVLRGPEPEVVLAAIERYRVTKFFAPPTVWIALLNSPAWASTDVSSLRKAYYGASPMPVEVLGALREQLPGVQLRNMYGQTELAPLATVLQPQDQLPLAGSAGRPTLNVSTAIVDDDGMPLPAGEVGEIVHRSPHAFLGYFRDPERTDEAFRGGWFHSGDLGYLNDSGYLYVVDRKKDMIKSGGENVASREVEEALYGLVGVAEVAVIGLPHPTWIEAVTAVVVALPGTFLTPADVLKHGRDTLTSFKRPKYAVIVESLPKNPSGKILKRQLREQFAGLIGES